jgi:hypothetical protein
MEVKGSHVMQTLSHNVVSSIPHQKYLQSRRTLYSHCLSFLLFLLERVNKGYFHWILHDMGPFYLHQRDITPIKIYNFRIKSEMLKWSIMAKTPKRTIERTNNVSIMFSYFVDIFGEVYSIQHYVIKFVSD